MLESCSTQRQIANFCLDGHFVYLILQPMFLIPTKNCQRMLRCPGFEIFNIISLKKYIENHFSGLIELRKSKLLIIVHKRLLYFTE